MTCKYDVPYCRYDHDKQNTMGFCEPMIRGSITRIPFDADENDPHYKAFLKEIR